MRSMMSRTVEHRSLLDLETCLRMARQGANNGWYLLVFQRTLKSNDKQLNHASIKWFNSQYQWSLKSILAYALGCLDTAVMALDRFWGSHATGLVKQPHGVVFDTGAKIKK